MAKNFPIVYFKGINTKTSDLLMAEDELKEAVNVDLSRPGIIQKRPGYQQRGNDLTSQIRGLFPYYNSNGTAYLVACYDDPNDSTTLLIRARTTWYFSIDVGSLYPYGGAEISAVNFIDKIYFVGWLESQRTRLQVCSWDDTTFTNGVTDSPSGRYIDVVNGYLCVANVTYGAQTGTSRVVWADPPTTLPYAITWDNTNNWWDFEPHNGEEITGIKSNFNRLLVFKNTSTHIFDPVGQDAKMISNSIGCDSHRSIQNIDKFTIFYNRKGVYATNGQEIQLISNPVEKFIQNIDQDNIFDVCAGARDNRYYHLFIGTLTVDGTVYTNCELVYDVLQNSWTTNELAHVVTIYCNYTQPTETTTTSTSSSSSSSSSLTTSSSSMSTSSSSSSSSSISITTSSSSSSSSSSISTTTT